VEALDSIALAVNPDAKRDPWQVTNAVCRYGVDPTIWTRHVNDQAIVIGWAGYDDKVQYLPPEHFLALEFRTALWEACQGGELSRCGPDGKLIVRLREDDDGFALEHVLVTLEHPCALSVFDLAARVSAVLARRYEALRRADARWCVGVARGGAAREPERSAVRCGEPEGQRSDGSKLVMDYYGRRCRSAARDLRQHPSHVDRFGADGAGTRDRRREARGGECLIRAVYAERLGAAGRAGGDEWRRDVRIDRARLVPRGRQRGS
jgi:S-adenosylmethionine synthetase